MSDLSWLDRKQYFFFIEDAHEMLMDTDVNDFSSFLNLLESISVEWSQPVSLGEEWDRDTVPFYIIFQYADNNQRSKRLANVPDLEHL